MPRNVQEPGELAGNTHDLGGVEWGVDISPSHPELLLAHVDFVRSLARALVLDPHTGDDVAQDAWLKALQHPPPHTRALRAWLTSPT